MAYENARKFLERVLPWPVGGESFINLHYKFMGTPRTDGSMPWSGVAAHGIDSVIHNLAYNMRRKSTLDMYVCMSSQLEARQWSKNGYTGYRAMRSKSNVVALRSFVIDVDVKPDGYANSKDALRAIGKFIRDACLPMPTVLVSSGTGGYHVYWTIDHNMSFDEWAPLSRALAEATKAYNFKVDTACTIDAARIMRVPETFNYKQNPPLNVVMGTMRDEDCDIGSMQRPLAMFMDNIIPKLTAPKLTSGVTDHNTTADNSELEIKYAPVNMGKVAETCGFVAATLAEGGAKNSGLLWNITTLMALFCENPVGTAHRMANKHKDYSSIETDELIARKRQEKEQHGFGWPSCAAINSAGSKHCAACPNFGKGKSPIHFAVIPSLAVAPSAIDSAGSIVAATQQSMLNFGHAAGLPDGYSQDDSGRVSYHKTLPDGSIEKILIYDFPIMSVWLQTNPYTLHFTTRTNGGKEQRVIMPTVEFSTKEGLAKKLGKEALFSKSRNLAQFQEFLMSWTNKLHITRGATVASSSFGWIVDHGKLDGFSYGGSLWTPSGKSISCQPDAIVSRQYAPKGLAKPWLDAARLITSQRRPGLNAILASAFAAPLVRFTGHSGLLMSCYSQESGIGKSTALKIAQSVWGNPITAVQSLGDTQASVIKKIGETKNLPLYWDELKTETDTTKFINMVFQLSLGKEKSRLNSDITQRESGTWQTLMVSASNDSILGQVIKQTRTTTAGIFRVFEYTLLPGVIGQIDAGGAARIVSKLHDNYGGIGLLYSKWLGENFARVDKDMGELLKSLEDELYARSDERFWIGLMACLLQGAIYSNELKLTHIDTVQLKNFLVQTLLRMRNEIGVQNVDMAKVMNVTDILGRFLSEMRARNTIRTDLMFIGRAPKNIIVRINSDTTRLDAIHVHIATESKRIRICRSKLIDWLDDRNISQHIFFAALVAHFDMHQLTGVLGAGTPLAMAQQHLLDIDLSGANMRIILGEG